MGTPSKVCGIFIIALTVTSYMPGTSAKNINGTTEATPQNTSLNTDHKIAITVGCIICLGLLCCFIVFYRKYNDNCIKKWCCSSACRRDTTEKEETPLYGKSHSIISQDRAQPNGYVAVVTNRSRGNTVDEYDVTDGNDKVAAINLVLPTQQQPPQWQPQQQHQPQQQQLQKHQIEEEQEHAEEQNNTNTSCLTVNNLSAEHFSELRKKLDVIGLGCDVWKKVARQLLDVHGQQAFTSWDIVLFGWCWSGGGDPVEEFFNVLKTRFPDLTVGQFQEKAILLKHNQLAQALTGAKNSRFNHKDYEGKNDNYLKVVVHSCYQDLMAKFGFTRQEFKAVEATIRKNTKNSPAEAMLDELQEKHGNMPITHLVSELKRLKLNNIAEQIAYFFNLDLDDINDDDGVN